MSYYIWIPLVIFFYSLQAYFSFKNSQSNQEAMFWMFMTWGITCVPMWAIISKYSNNILFDGILFDILVTLIYVAVMLICGEGEYFSYKNYVGLVLIIFGMFLLKGVL